ncbi:hypothetical protein [Plantactinospora sp. GCM10030261]|uniref:hypothetical protein n=1 Tax=Plantactinospora sp. GCM10030261 TaxID=3273420 RepID=UPI00361096BE
MNVRRLAAIDMYGGAGSRVRRRVILIEFVAGAIGLPLIALWSASDSQSAGRLVFAAWLLGVGVNYVPLALHAMSLSRPGALEAELADVDVFGELRRYTAAQLWVLVPLLLVGLAVRQRGR